MVNDLNYIQHTSIMKNLNMDNDFNEAIYAKANSQNITLSNAKEFRDIIENFFEQLQQNYNKIKQTKAYYNIQ